MGVSTVGIYRNCLRGHRQSGTCQVLGANNVVFIANAVVRGRRPPRHPGRLSSYPFAYRAGWGYLLLTNMLPHVTAPANASGGGQGPISIFAYATDVENNRVLLGQRAITLDNDHATHPFGAIDTPSQGGTASNVFTNFGWALTPGRRRFRWTAPRSPSSSMAWRSAMATYDQCRSGAIKPPVGTCHDDVATLFPGYTNITGGSGAIGSFNIDTRTLANGTHTIAWSVTDDQGRSDGIGSRFFQVTNGSA